MGATLEHVNEIGRRKKYSRHETARVCLSPYFCNNLSIFGDKIEPCPTRAWWISLLFGLLLSKSPHLGGKEH